MPAANGFEDAGFGSTTCSNHGERWQQVPVHPNVLSVVERVLDRGCLSSLSSIDIRPDEDAQPIHASQYPSRSRIRRRCAAPCGRSPTSPTPTAPPGWCPAATSPRRTRSSATYDTVAAEMQGVGARVARQPVARQGRQPLRNSSGHRHELLRRLPSASRRTSSSACRPWCAAPEAPPAARRSSWPRPDRPIMLRRDPRSLLTDESGSGMIWDATWQPPRRRTGDDGCEGRSGAEHHGGGDAGSSRPGCSPGAFHGPSSAATAPGTGSGASRVAPGTTAGRWSRSSSAATGVAKPRSSSAAAVRYMSGTSNSTASIVRPSRVAAATSNGRRPR